MARARKPSVSNAPVRRSARLQSREASIEVVAASSSAAVVPAVLPTQQHGRRGRRAAAVQELRQLSPIPASPTDASPPKLAAATSTVAENTRAASPSVSPSRAAQAADQQHELAQEATDAPAPVSPPPAVSSPAAAATAASPPPPPSSPTPRPSVLLPAAVTEEWDTEEVVRLIVDENEFALIAELTEWQCKAVAYSLAEKAQQQAAEIADLKEQVVERDDALVYATRRNKMPSVFREMSLQNIEDAYGVAKAKEREKIEAEVLAKHAAEREKTTAGEAKEPQLHNPLGQVTGQEEAPQSSPGQVTGRELATVEKATEPRRSPSPSLSPSLSPSPRGAEISSFISADLIESTPIAMARRAPQEPEDFSPAGSEADAENIHTLHAADVATRPPMRPPTPDMSEAPSETPWRRVVNFLRSPFVGRKRAAAEMEDTTPQPPATAPVKRIANGAHDSDLPLHKRIRIEHKTTPYMSRNPARRPRPSTQNTPRLSHHDLPQHSRLVPSAKNSRVPTSLKTVTEYTESIMSPVNELPDPTPSKPAKASKLDSNSMAGAFPDSSSSLLSQSASLTEAAEQPTPAPARIVRDKTPYRPRPRRWSERRRLPKRKYEGDDDDDDEYIYDSCLGPNGRVHKDSGFLPTDGKRLYAWELPAAQQSTPRTYGAFSRKATPRVPSAEERLAKIQRFRDLQRELAEAATDKDIADVVSRKVKRVKVDHLTVIPHNLPGDSDSTFRVPEIDSDDEMEVVEADSLSSNMFMDYETEKQTPKVEDYQPAQPAQDQPTESAEAQQSMSAEVQPSMPAEVQQSTPAPFVWKYKPAYVQPAKPAGVQPATQAPAQIEQTTVESPEDAEQIEQARLLFPDLGPPPEGYSVTPEEMEECRLMFLDILTEYGVPHNI